MRLAVKFSPMVDHADGTIRNFDGMLTDIHNPLQSNLVELQQTLAQGKTVLASMQVLIKDNDYKIDDTIENLRLWTASAQISS